MTGLRTLEGFENYQARHKRAIEAILFAADLLGENLQVYENLIEAESRMHAAMPILDPTLYKQAIHSKNLKWQLELATATVSFISTARRVRAELAASNAEAAHQFFEELLGGKS